METSPVNLELARRRQMHCIRSTCAEWRRYPIHSQIDRPWCCNGRVRRWIFERTEDQGFTQRHEIWYENTHDVKHNRFLLPNLGMVAAEAIFSALKDASEADKSKPVYLSKYPEMLKRSWLWDDLYRGTFTKLYNIIFVVFIVKFPQCEIFARRSNLELFLVCCTAVPIWSLAVKSRGHFTTNMRIMRD